MRSHPGDPPSRRHSPRSRPAVALCGIGLAAALVAGACGRDGTSASSSTTAAESTVATAPDSERVDLGQPSFSNPTAVTNPLFPISDVRQVLQLGEEGGEPLRIEVTLLPGTKTVDWEGRPVETAVSQYAAYLDGRILEVALDYFAQADDGSVWYFGEDVANYEDGVVADREGTWLAGRDGPPGMIMPADPARGDVYRPENVPGLVFEEVTVKSADETVAGPQGLVNGAILVEERLMDGTSEEKAFAPGYGEFRAQAEDELVTVALAVPRDVTAGPVPAEIERLSAATIDVLDAAQSEDWARASTALEEATSSWAAQEAGVPELLAAQMSDALDALVAGVEARDPAPAIQSCIAVAGASLDLQLRHRPPAAVDLDRLDLVARQLQVDAGADDVAGAKGAVATLETIWQRFAHAVPRAGAQAIDAQLGELRSIIDAGDTQGAARSASTLRDTLEGLEAAA